MKAILYLIIFFSFTAITSGQYPDSYFEVNDTLTVFTPNGINLRENPELNSNKVQRIPFGTKLVVRSSYYENLKDNLIEFENKQGGWIKVRNDNLDGYVFSGFLTNKKIPIFKQDKINCLRASRFLEFVQLNLGDTIAFGVDTIRYFGKGGIEINKWTMFEKGDEVINEVSYENLDIIIESYQFTMNDVFNYLESFVHFNCDQNFDSLKLKISKNELGFIRQLKCKELWFEAELSLNKLIIRYNSYSL